MFEKFGFRAQNPYMFEKFGFRAQNPHMSSKFIFDYVYPLKDGLSFFKTLVAMNIDSMDIDNANDSKGVIEFPVSYVQFPSVSKEPSFVFNYDTLHKIDQIFPPREKRLQREKEQKRLLEAAKNSREMQFTDAMGVFDKQMQIFCHFCYEEDLTPSARAMKPILRRSIHCYHMQKTTAAYDKSSNYVWDIAIRNDYFGVRSFAGYKLFGGQLRFTINRNLANWIWSDKSIASFGSKGIAYGFGDLNRRIVLFVSGDLHRPSGPYIEINDFVPEHATPNRFNYSRHNVYCLVSPFVNFKFKTTDAMIPSPFPGVTYNENTEKWYGGVCLLPKSKPTKIGVFDTEREACTAVGAALDAALGYTKYAKYRSVVSIYDDDGKFKPKLFTFDKFTDLALYLRPAIAKCFRIPPAPHPDFYKFQFKSLVESARRNRGDKLADELIARSERAKKSRNSMKNLTRYAIKNGVATKEDIRMGKIHQFKIRLTIEHQMMKW